MKYESIPQPSASGHQVALYAQTARRTAPYPATIYDANNSNVYHFVHTANDSTMRAGYSLSGDDENGLFWYSRGVDGKMQPLYGGPDLRGESSKKVDARPAW